MNTEQTCIRCGKSLKDFIDVPFPADVQFSIDGYCISCKQSFERYKQKQNKTNNNDNPKQL